MKRVWKRTVSMLLVLVMLMGVLPTQAFAAGPQAKEDPVSAVQALINGLDTEVSSGEEAAALNDALSEVLDAIAELTSEEAETLDLTRYEAATAALEAYTQQPDEPETLADKTYNGELEAKDGQTTVKEMLKAVSQSATAGIFYSIKPPVSESFTANTTGLLADKSTDTSFDVNDGSTYTITWTTGIGNWKKSHEATIAIKVYHNITATVTEKPENVDDVTVTVANDGKVYHGQSATISVTPVDDYKAEVYDSNDGLVVTLNKDNNWTASIPNVTASGEYTVKYVSTKVTEYDLTLTVAGDEDCGTAVLGKNKGAAGEEIALTITPKESTDSIKYSYTVEVAGEGASYNKETGKITVGTEDVTVTVTFTKDELSANGTAAVPFNGFYEAKDQKDTLSGAILNALDVQFNGTPLNESNVSNVSIQYWPYAYGALFGASIADFNEDSARDLDKNAPDNTWSDTLKTGLKYYDFGERFRDETYTASDKNTEKVIISYKVDENTTLSVTREITLTEGRKTLPTDLRTSSETVTEDAIKAAAAAKAKEAGLGELSFALEDGWESKLVSGQAVDIIATAPFGGNAEYVGGEVKVKVSVTKVEEPAVITVTTTGSGSGTHDIPATPYAGTVSFNVTPTNDGSYVESVTVDGTPVTLTYKDTAASGSFTVANDQTYTVEITYGKVTLGVAENAEVKLNLYVANYVDYSARLEGLKGKLLTALLGKGVNEEDYEVYVYTTKLTSLGKDEYKTTDDLTLYASQIEDTIKVKIEKKASADGKLPAVSVKDIEVKVVESRQAANISDYTGNKTFSADTESKFKTDVENAVKETITVTDYDGYNIKDKTNLLGISLLSIDVAVKDDGTFPTTADGETTYTVAVTMNEGENWLKTTKTFEVIAKINCYTVTWKDGNGNTLTTNRVAYGQTPAYTGETPTKASTVDKVFTWNNGWTPAVSKVNGPAEYTATFSESAREYTITWNAGDGTFKDDKKELTTSVAYGSTPTAPEEPTATEKSFDGWDTEIETVTGAATYTAKYSDDVIYKVTFIYNGNGTDDTVVRVNATKGDKITKPEDPNWTDHLFTGWECNVSGVKFGETPSCTEKEITFTAQWADDINGNKVDDKTETITVVVEEANESDTVKITGAVEGKGENEWVYDSKNSSVTVTATPTTHLDGLIRYSDTYVASILLNDNGQTLTYGDKYAARFTFTPQNGNTIRVTFAEAKFTLKDPRTLLFYVGIETPTYESLYQAAVEAPVYDTEAVQSVKYLAREAGEYELDLSSICKMLADIPVFGSVAAGTFDALYPNGTATVTLSEKWLDVGTVIDEGSIEDVWNEEIEKIEALIEAGNWRDAISAIGTLISNFTDKVGTIGCRKFGDTTDKATLDEDGNVVETLYIIYKDERLHIEDQTVTVTLVDDRIATELTSADASIIYKDHTADSLWALISEHTQLTDEDGDAVTGTVYAKQAKLTELTTADVGTYELTLKFDGDRQYKPSETTIQVTIAQATASIDVPNVLTTYGKTYSMAPTVTRNNRYGADTDITDSLIQFVVGLDVADLTVEDQKVTGLDTTIQLILPNSLKGDFEEAMGSLGDLIGIGDQIDAIFGNGVEISLDSLVDLLELLSGIIDDDSLATLKQALEAIIDAVDVAGLTIKLGGNLPTDIGTYLYGAVSTNSNYTTAFDVAYIVITPATQRVYLGWDYSASNGLFTQEMLKTMSLGASAYTDEALTAKSTSASEKVRNLFFGVNKNTETGKPALVFKLYGTDVDTERFETELGNGAFTQMAFIADFGNELDYAIPIIRAFAIVPNTAKVEFVDASGVVNADRKFTYDGKAHSMNVRVTLDNAVITPAAGELTVTYMGVTTAGETYQDTKTPTEAGVYTAVAVFGRRENGKLSAVGAAVGAMVILPAQVDFSITGGTVDYDGQPHGVTVKPTDKDYTLISGTASVAGNVTEVGLEAITANLNVDFPAWVDDLLKEKFPNTYANGINATTLVEILEQYRETLTAAGIKETWLDAVVTALEKVSADMTVTFKDHVTFTDPGVYVFFGLLTDPNYVPACDTGLLVIRKEDSSLAFVDTEVVYDGNGHMITVTNPKQTDYVTVIVDRKNNIGNILFEDDLAALKALLETELGLTVPAVVNVGAIRSAIDTVLTKLESLEGLPTNAADLLAQLRTVLNRLPQSGTVYLDGAWRPTNVGAYEFYGLAVSPRYATTVLSGKLTITPAAVTITVADKEKVHGDADPEFTGTVAGVVEGDDLHVEYKRAAGQTGENAGDTITITATYTDDPNYTVTVVDGTLTITKKPLTEAFAQATLAGTLTYNGSEQTQNVTLADGITYTVSGNKGTNATTYTLTITGTGNYSGTLTLDWSIAKKPASVTVADQEINNSETIDQSQYTASGFVDGDDIQITLTVDGTKIKAVVSGEDASNYDVSFTDGTLTVEENGGNTGDGGSGDGDNSNPGDDGGNGGSGGGSGSGGSGSGGGGGSASGMVYDIVVKNDQNGTVTANRTEATAGTTVMLTSVPKKGYTLQSLTVTRNKGGKAVKLTREAGRYTFVMPAADVTVTAVYTTGGASFGDVADDAYYSDAVYWAAENGIANGVTANSFVPNGICTRAQAVTFLWRAAGCPAPVNRENPFTDVLPGFYYYDAVLWAVENDITKGTTETTFSPDMTCNRSHIVTFLWRAYSKLTPKAINVFTDVAEGTYYAEAALWAVENGITKGMTATLFAPAQGCTRAQIVTFLYRFFKQ